MVMYEMRRLGQILRGHDYGPVGLFLGLSEVAFGAWLMLPSSEADLFWRALADNTYSPHIRGAAHLAIGLAQFATTILGPRWMRWPFFVGAFLWLTSAMLYAFALPNSPAVYFWTLYSAGSLWVALRAESDA